MGEVLEFGDAYAVLSAHHPVKGHGLFHDPVRFIGGSGHHLPVVGENRDVDMNIAVSCMHVGGNDDESVQGLFSYLLEVFRHPGVTTEKLHEAGEKFFRIGAPLKA